MIHVIATIALRPGARPAFLTEFARVVAPVRAEAGCLEYAAGVDLTTGIAGQEEIRTDAVIVVEKWRDVAALEAHLSAPHMVAYRARVAEHVTSVALHILEPIVESAPVAP